MAITSKERIRMLMSGEIPDRIGKADAPWPETRARWNKEGLPATIHASDYFGMDIRMLIKINASFMLEERVVEETDEIQTISDADGNIIKYWKGKSGVPLPVKPAIGSREDWERMKDRLAPDTGRFAFSYYGNYQYEYTTGTIENVKAAYDACTTKETTSVCMDTLGPYEFLMNKMGDENVLMKMATEPELLTEMLEAYVKMMMGCARMLFGAGFRPDGVFFGDDIAYKNGLLFSPKMHRELILPHLKGLMQHYKKEYGLYIIHHCDGNNVEAFPIYVEAGVDCLEPLECNAGLDVRKLAKEWGKQFAFMGNISVQTLSGPKEALEEEVRTKIEACKKARARFVIHSDHSVPPTVPFENYKLMMELVDKYGKY